jgi:hypothetical protein
MEYNTPQQEPHNKLDHFVNTLQQHNEDFDPGINDTFLNNLDPTFYAMQMQNPHVLTLLIPQVRQAHKYPNSPWETI